jgi:hypothetical protein
MMYSRFASNRQKIFGASRPRSNSTNSNLTLCVGGSSIKKTVKSTDSLLMASCHSGLLWCINRRHKTFLKSTMSQARLNSVLLLPVHKELSPDIKSVMAEFNGLNDTRRRIFGDIWHRLLQLELLLFFVLSSCGSN